MIPLPLENDDYNSLRVVIKLLRRFRLRIKWLKKTCGKNTNRRIHCFLRFQTVDQFNINTFRHRNICLSLPAMQNIPLYSDSCIGISSFNLYRCQNYLYAAISGIGTITNIFRRCPFFQNPAISSSIIERFIAFVAQLFKVHRYTQQMSFPGCWLSPNR